MARERARNLFFFFGQQYELINLNSLMILAKRSFMLRLRNLIYCLQLNLYPIKEGSIWREWFTPTKQLHLQNMNKTCFFFILYKINKRWLFYFKKLTKHVKYWLTTNADQWIFFLNVAAISKIYILLLLIKSRQMWQKNDSELFVGTKFKWVRRKCGTQFN